MITQRLIDQLKSDEGFRAEPYHDHLGWLTIGYGTLIDPRKGARGVDDLLVDGKLPERTAEGLLVTKLQRMVDHLLREEPRVALMPQHVQEALYNMIYQMGVHGVLKFRNMWKHLKAGDWEMAAVEALNSRWARQTPNRANRVATLMRKEP